MGISNPVDILQLATSLIPFVQIVPQHLHNKFSFHLKVKLFNKIKVKIKNKTKKAYFPELTVLF